MGLTEFLRPLAHQFLQMLTVEPILLQKPGFLKCPFDDDLKRFWILDRLYDVVPCAEAKRIDGVLHGTGAGDHDNGCLRALLSKSGNHRKPIHHRHPQIGQDQVGPFPVKGIEPLPSVGGLDDTIAEILQQHPQVQADQFFIVHNQYFCRLAHVLLSPIGSLTLKTVPLPGVDCTSMSPLWFWVTIM